MQVLLLALLSVSIPRYTSSTGAQVWLVSWNVAGDVPPAPQFKTGSGEKLRQKKVLPGDRMQGFSGGRLVPHQESRASIGAPPRRGVENGVTNSSGKNMTPTGQPQEDVVAFTLLLWLSLKHDWRNETRSRGSREFGQTCSFRLSCFWGW